MAKFILGIDPGMVNTGWGIIKVENNKPFYIAEGNIKTNKNENFQNRIYHIFKEINNIFNIYSIDIAGIEDTFVNINPKSSLELAQAKSAAMLAVKHNNCECINVNNKQLKKYISSFGSSTKLQMQNSVKMLIPDAKLLNEHSADALAVAIYCFVNNGGEKIDSNKINNLKIIG